MRSSLWPRAGMIEIDGSVGEGGGQVLRTALCLSMVTGRAFRMFRVRARRDNPGLRRQHLVAVRAAQAVSAARVDGAEPGASEITFAPSELCPGDYAFDIGTAGSTTLVAQTLIPALMLASKPFGVRLEGGTHNPMSPPFEFLDRSYLPLLARMGACIGLKLVRPGYYPAGGGCVEMTTTPAEGLSALGLSRRGRLLAKEAHATVSNLPLSIAHRELAGIRSGLGWPQEVTYAHDETRGKGPGNAVIVVLTFERITAVFAGFGRRGVPAEKVAEGVVRRVSAYLASDVAVEPCLADQLLVPMAVAGGGKFTTLHPTQHARTNMRIIEMFLPVKFQTLRLHGNVWRISV